MFNKDLLNSAYNNINLQKIFNDSISQKYLKNEFSFSNKDNTQRKFNLNKNDSKIKQLKFQTINKKYLNQVVKLNFRVEHILKRQCKNSQQTNYKNKVKAKKQMIIGGGCGSSKTQQNPFKKVFQKKQINNDDLDQEFNQKVDNFINKDDIVKNIEQKIQVSKQIEIINILENHFNSNKIVDRPKIIELIDVYLIYALTGLTQKRVLKQSQFKDLEIELKKMKESFKMEQIPCDLIFYFDILYRLNQTIISWNEQNEKQYTKVVEFFSTISLVSSGEKLKEDLKEIQQEVTNLVNSNEKSQTNQIFTYLLNIWIKKIDYFQDKIWNLTLLEEVKFYIKTFNELYEQKKCETELLLIVLIKIDYYISLAIKKQQNLKALVQELSLNIIPELILSDFDRFHEFESFLQLTVQNHICRFLTISILLKYFQIIEIQDDKEQIMECLCYKYLCEKNIQVKIAFDTNCKIEISNLKQVIKQFEDKIIQFSKNRRETLQKFELENYESIIKNSQDIKKMIDAIEDKEMCGISKCQDNITQKDFDQLELNEFYVKQQITFQEGNKIFQKQSLTQINENNQLEQSYADQEILDNFLQVNIITQENQNQNISSLNVLNQCKILGILAEGGTGKSILIKKLETILIQNSGKKKYIPLLIKCNSLDPEQPSIENYLQNEKIISSEINQIKNSDDNKVILLDGYDEFAGEYFRVYQKLNLSSWKNTKVIVTVRKEKMEQNEACFKFSLDDVNGIRDETSFCLVKLEEFTNKDIEEYCKTYFRFYRSKEEKFDEQQYQSDLEAMNDSMKNPQLESLLYLPINLYLFTRMIVQVQDKNEIQKIKENISDQVQIQENFFLEQFKTKAHEFVQIFKDHKKRDNDFYQLVQNSFFEYFQSISMEMFLNKGKPEIINFLQIQSDQIQFKLSEQIEKKLDQNEKSILLGKIICYLKSNVITRSKEENPKESQKKVENESYQIEFKHKSLFEYFVARAMKYDFDVHGENICNLDIEQLKEFRINKKCIMNIGKNKSEQQILLKLYKMIKKEIESNEFKSNYNLQQIEKNNRYIQFIKKSKINKNTETSQIDIGASNMLSALFISSFNYSGLELKLCSFSKLFGSCKKSNQINFDNCNLKNSYLKNLQINYESCNTQFANFGDFQNVFDTSNFFSFKQVIWDKDYMLYTITKSGYIISFKIENYCILRQKQKQLSKTSLSQILKFDEKTLLVSSQYQIFEINSISFDIQKSEKFLNKIRSIIKIKENILIEFKNEDIYLGSLKNGFRKMDINGSRCVYNEQKQILLLNPIGGYLSFYNEQENFKLIKTIKGHNSNIASTVFSADGKYLATGSSDSTCKIWNVEQGYELIETISQHSDKISSVAFSADGKYIATGSLDNTCNIWDVKADFEQIYQIQGHINKIKSVAFSIDGEYLATSSSDNTCRIWDTKKEFKFFNKISGHIDQITSVAFSADGKYLVTGSRDKTCKIWSLDKEFDLINRFYGHMYNINSVAFSRDGKYLVTGSSDWTFRIWNAEEGYKYITAIEGHRDEVNSVAFSAKGEFLATGSSDNTIKIWIVEKGFELLKTIQDNSSKIKSVAFSANGKYLAAGSKDQICKIWDAEKEYNLIKKIKGHTQEINSVSFSEDGKYLATGSSDNTCRVWSIEKDFELINIIKGHADWINSVAFSEDGKYLATGSKDKTCKVWNIENGYELIITISSHTYEIKSVAFSLDGKYLATGSSDKTCKLWNIEKEIELINTNQSHTDAINSVAFSDDGNYLATGSSDKTCKIWNVEQGFELIKTIQGHTDCINSVAFSVDGTYLATGSSDKICIIWSAKKGYKILKKIQGHTKKINSVAFSSNGKYLATGSSDYTCKIMDVQKGFELLNMTQGHTDEINSVAFSASGKYLVTGSSDKTCKVWSTEKSFEVIQTIQIQDWVKSIAFSADENFLAASQYYKACILNVQKDYELIFQIQGHNSEINSVSFSPKGNYLAIGFSDNTCNLWSTQNDFKLIRSIFDHIGQISSVAFSKDEKYLATGSFDQTCKLYKIQADFQHVNRVDSHNQLIKSISLSADGKYLASNSRDNSCKIYFINDNIELQHTIPMKYKDQAVDINFVAISLEGKYLAGSSDNICYIIYDKQKLQNTKEDFKIIQALGDHTQKISSITFSQDGRYLVTGSYDTICNIYIWNTEINEFQLIKQLTEHTHYVSTVIFSEEGKYLATGSSDKTCKIWDVMKNFEIIMEAKIEHDHYISSIAFSFNEMYLATGSWDKTYKIWDVKENFKLIIQNSNFTSEILSITFSKNNKYLSTCTVDNNCKIWSLNKITENKQILSFDQININKFQFSNINEFICLEQLDQYYKLYIIKDFNPEEEKDLQNFKKITQTLKKEQKNETIYLKNSILFENTAEL